jgi:hypothetical protein
MQIPESTQCDVAIPGWHINGHGDGCRSNFNLSYMEGAGRTVGEDIETTWAGTNQLAPSVREMGPLWGFVRFFSYLYSSYIFILVWYQVLCS